MKSKRGVVGVMLLLAALLLLSEKTVEAKEAETIYNSPYVTFSPDGLAWTTNAGDTNYVWYDVGTVVYTGIAPGLRSLNAGEHYYRISRAGTIPIGRWEVAHKTGACIHYSYPPEGIQWHGVEFERYICGRYYYSGWFAYCADCGERLTATLVYMSREAAESIDYLDVGDSDGRQMCYYYLCPWNNNLEQGVALEEHYCKEVSWNQYRVAYDPNVESDYGGYMEESIHMYNNATEYEGNPVTPSTHLTKNAFTRIGYEFVGWNTEPDGSGMGYVDEEEVFNLTDKDIKTHESGAVVTLYAQWRRSVSYLKIDPDGGSYRGSPTVTTVTGSYGSSYEADRNAVEAPVGYTVFFETNGGNEIEPITGTQHFVEWRRKQPFGGRMEEDIYYFIAPDQNRDTIVAEYAPDPIILPTPKWENHSFGGWYYDPEFVEPAGIGGDTVIPHRELTLYANWVELTLYAQNNYTANEGRGAVDLSWEQPDGQGKTYKLYQSRDNRSWTQINAAADIDNECGVEFSDDYTGTACTYTVPYTGFYTITVEGAQGGNYISGEKSASGGLGGRVSARVWLQADEVVTYIIGGQNGYNGGGSADTFANGGGCTVVSTDQKGILLIAGGGGGASAGQSGGAGGSVMSVRSDPADYVGGEGSAGGGGGYRGGLAGSYTPEEKGQNLRYLTFDALTTIYVAYHLENNQITEGSADGRTVYLYVAGSKRMVQGEELVQVTGTKDYIEFNGEKWYVESQRESTTVAYLNRYPLSSVPITYSPSYGTKGGFGQCWPGFDQGDINGSFRLYQETEYVNKPEVITPAYGGSSYINTDYISDYTDAAGVRSGNGTFIIQSEIIGFVDNLALDGVIAADEASPDAVYQATVKKNALGQNRVNVSWKASADNGTVYYHVAESYLTGSSALLCRSNVTRNVLITGIGGYYCLVDDSEHTVVTHTDGNFTAEPNWTVTLKETVQYLHVAPVDRAGNLGETIHILLEPADIDFRWPLHTRQLEIEEGDSVYMDPDGRIYVRSNGETPFTLNYQAYMEGWAREDYQINYAAFESNAAGNIVQNILQCASSPVRKGGFPLSADDLTLTASGESLLAAYPITVVSRAEENRELKATQAFVLKPDADGVDMAIIPIAGADWQNEVVYSDYSEDRQNGLVITGDGTAPVIRGLEALSGLDLLDRRGGTVTLRVTADDNLSGVKDFYLEIYNTDNVIREIFWPDADGVIRVDITTDEPIFSGDFVVTAYAVDNVGNACSQSAGTTEFDLRSSIIRILEPHEPVFQCGESGMLTVTTWGYAERVEVEFPEELLALNPNLNQTFVYTNTPAYRHVEELQFMIPLQTPENTSYEITVRAYKGDRRMEDHPSLSVIGVSGTIADDVRTRLR